jgi:hypothetical protein
MQRVFVLPFLLVAVGAVAHLSPAFAQDTKSETAPSAPETTWVNLADDGVRLEVEEDSAHDEWVGV